MQSLIGLSRQMALRRELDVVSNNIANINTTGFKGDTAVFEEYVMPKARHDGFPGKHTGNCPTCMTAPPGTI